MSSALISLDQNVKYELDEVAQVIVLAIGYCMVMGGIAFLAYMSCGWKNVQSLRMDWFHGKAIVICKK